VQKPSPETYALAASPCPQHDSAGRVKWRDARRTVARYAAKLQSNRAAYRRNPAKFYARVKRYRLKKQTSEKRIS
jgi:hypothetical protein